MRKLSIPIVSPRSKVGRDDHAGTVFNDRLPIVAIIWKLRNGRRLVTPIFSGYYFQSAQVFNKLNI